HLVIFAGHGHFPSAGKIDEGQVHCAPPIVLAPLARIRHKLFLALGCCFPEHLRDRPRAVAVEDHQPVSLRAKRSVYAYEGLGGGRCRNARASRYTARPRKWSWVA